MNIHDTKLNRDLESVLNRLDGGREMFKNDALFHHMMYLLLTGHDPYVVVQSLCKIINDQQGYLIEQAMHGIRLHFVMPQRKAQP